MKEFNLPETKYYPSLCSVQRVPLLRPEHLTLISQIRICNKTGMETEDITKIRPAVKDLRINLFVRDGGKDCSIYMDLLLSANKRSYKLLDNNEHLVLRKGQELYCSSSSLDQIFDCTISSVTYYEDLEGV